MNYTNLEKILRQFSTEILILENSILKDIKTEVVLFNKISNYILKSGGKRIRPVLVMLGASIFSKFNEKTLKTAQIIEYLHTGTLLHDDVIDNSDTRRSKITAWKIWGNEASIS